MYTRLSLDIERYYKSLEREKEASLRGMAYLQYPLYCLHCSVKAVVKGDLVKLDKHICQMIRLNISTMGMSNALGVSKTFINGRIIHLVSQELLERDVDDIKVSELGIETFFSDSPAVIYEIIEQDIYVDGLTHEILNADFLRFNQRYFIAQGEEMVYQSYGKEKRRDAYEPDLTHKPISLNIDEELLQGDLTQLSLTDITEIKLINYTPMTFPVLLALSVGQTVNRELVNGYYQTSNLERLGVNAELKSLFDRLVIRTKRVNKAKGQEKESRAYFGTNLRELNTGSVDGTIFSVAKDDFSQTLCQKYALVKEPSEIQCKAHELIFNVDKTTLLSARSFRRPKLIEGIIRGRDYFINHSPGINGCWLAFITITDSDCGYVKEVCQVYEIFRQIKGNEDIKTRLDQLDKELTHSLRDLLIVCGYMNLSEAWDMASFMFDPELSKDD